MDAYGIRGYNLKSSDSELLRALQPTGAGSSRRSPSVLPSRHAPTPIHPNHQPLSGSATRTETSVHPFHSSTESASTAVGRKMIDRNRRPCGSCSSSKRKCKLISTSPMLCQRCKSRGLSECPPHISWSDRRNSSTSPTDGFPIGSDSNYLQSSSYDPTAMFGLGFEQDDLASLSSASSPGLQEGLSPDPNSAGIDAADNFPQALRYAMMSRNPPALPDLASSANTSFSIISNVMPACELCVCRTCNTQFKVRYSPYPTGNPSGRSNASPGTFSQLHNPTNAMNYLHI